MSKSNSTIAQGVMGEGHLHPAGLDFVADPGAYPEFLVRPTTILDEAKSQIYGEKAADYGDAAESMLAIATLWSAYIKAKYKIVVDLSAEDTAWMMAQLKTARAMYKYKRDNQIDAAGYIGLADDIGRKSCGE